MDSWLSLSVEGFVVLICDFYPILAMVIFLDPPLFYLRVTF